MPTARIMSPSSSRNSSSRKKLCLRLSTSSTPPTFSGFDSDQMDALTQRGILEASLMEASSAGALEEITKGSNKKKKAKAKESKKKKAPSTAIIARTLSQEGVVRLNGILSATTAASLREEILKRRADAYAAVSSNESSEGGSGAGGAEWRKYFADVLLKKERCDLLLPLKGNHGLQKALHEILVSSNVLFNVLSSAVGGDDATLYELAALISQPGSPRQPVHPDNPYQEQSPLFTVFIALQDVTDEMGPTVFLPRTQTATAHTAYNDIPKRNDFLESSPSVSALLNAGDASLFDSRTMHCGGANDKSEGDTRVLLYMSFRNPRATEPIGNVGSILPEIQKMTIRDLRSKLATIGQKSDDNDPFDHEREREAAMNEIRQAAEQGDAFAQLEVGTGYYLGENGFETDHIEAVRWFELAAAQGVARAQFNLGYCYSVGTGVPENDLERAMKLFQQAAGQGYPGAQEAFDEASSEMERIQGR